MIVSPQKAWSSACTWYRLREKPSRGIRRPLALFESAEHVKYMPTAPPASRDVALETRFFLERFKKEIIAVLIVALLGVMAFTGYRYYSDRRAAASAASLAGAKTVQEYRAVIDHYPQPS